eukprot:scaffold293551_cov31-Tisochrysis_lutea.AAC.4
MSMKREGTIRGFHEVRSAARSGAIPPDSHTTNASWIEPIVVYLRKMSTISMCALQVAASTCTQFVALQ